MNEQITERDRRTAAPAPPPAAPPRRASRVAWLWLLLGLVAVAAAVWALRPAQQARPPGGRFALTAPMVVVPDTAKLADLPLTVSALGTVTPLATVTVRPQVSGQLLRLAFAEGQHVQQGDLLAEIDPRPFQAVLDQMQGQLIRDQALLKNAQTDLARYQLLVKQDSIARQQLDTQAALVAQYQGTVRADQGQVDAAKVNLSYTRIVAPISGRVGLRQVDAGNYVQVGEASGLVVITQLQPITAIFTVPEDNLPDITRRLRQGAELPVTALDRTASRLLATGRLTTVDNQIDPATGTVKLRAEFANPDEALFPNQFVNVELLVDTLKGAVTVPVPAVQRGAPGTFVYVIKPDGTVAVRPVTTGPSTVDRVAILKGLAVGEQVVVDGADKLRDGAQVTIAGAQKPAAAGAVVAPAPPAADGQRQRRKPAGTAGRRRRRRMSGPARR
ncbi:MAG: MdtA/MuxA family multidrug efflux RND transporter periplasmic adaptor subunit [Dongiaceae bacterium]